jgi:GNAT superfamily N-acetyltransferase
LGVVDLPYLLYPNFLLGVLPEYRRRGLDAFLVLSTIDEGRRAGYAAAQLGWVADDNVVLRNALARLGAVVDKEYALFERSL